MRFFPVVASGLLLAARGEDATLTYCNSEANMNWVLLNPPSSYNQIPTQYVVQPLDCQSKMTYNEYQYSFMYHVCNTTGVIDYSDSRCYSQSKGGIWGNYIGNLNITIDFDQTTHALNANFMPETADAQNMIVSACQSSDSYYDIYINTPDNIPPCVFSNDDSSNDDDQSDDHSSKKHGYSLTLQDKIVIGILAGGFGVCICGVLCFAALEKICGWGVVEQRDPNPPRSVVRSPITPRFYRERTCKQEIEDKIFDQYGNEIASSKFSAQSSTHEQV